MSNKPPRPKSTEEILREMESMSEGIGSSSAEKSSGKGAFKSLMDFFIKVEPEEGGAAPPEVTKPQPPRAGGQPAIPRLPQTSQRVGDLAADEPPPRLKVPSNAGASDLAQREFEQIFKDAGLPKSPCSVDELATLMENPSIANQPLSVKIIAVNLALSAKGVGVDVPITDAVRRDRALDAYQKMLSDRAHTIEQRNQEKIQMISTEVEEYLKRKQAEMEALRGESTEAQRQMIDFSVRREAEEKRLADLISPFLEGKPNPVSIGSQGSEPPPESAG